MNDRKFLGLLNLYLDGEIDSNSAAGLEREILSDPRRQEVYAEYCRIHRATKLVYERFRTAATEQDAAGMHAMRQNVFSADGLAEADATDTGRGPVHTAAYWLGGVAAACAAAYAVFLLAPQAPTPKGEAPLAAIAPSTQQGLSASAVPAATETPLVAPFAPEFRLDPFLANRPFEHRSPFSFSSEPARGGFVGFEPAPIKTFYLGSQIGGAQTSFHGMALIPTDADSADSRIFRHTSDGEPVQFEPVGFQIQR